MIQRSCSDDLAATAFSKGRRRWSIFIPGATIVLCVPSSHVPQSEPLKKPNRLDHGLCTASRAMYVTDLAISLLFLGRTALVMRDHTRQKIHTRSPFFALTNHDIHDRVHCSLCASLRPRGPICNHTFRCTGHRLFINQMSN